MEIKEARKDMLGRMKLRCARMWVGRDCCLGGVKN